MSEAVDKQGPEEAWDPELARRVADLRSGKAVGKPAEQLFEELRREREESSGAGEGAAVS